MLLDQVDQRADDPDQLEVLRGEHQRHTGGPQHVGILGGDDAADDHRGVAGRHGDLLDGHSNGAEQIAVAARDAGFEVVYQGIRLTADQIAAAARDEDVDVVGISILSGSHLQLVPEVLDRLRAAGVDAPVVVGGIIPEQDRPRLLALGVAAVYTPKDFELARIMGDLADLVARRRALAG